MRLGSRLAIAAVLATASALSVSARTQSGLFGPGDDAKTASHDFSVAKNAEPATRPRTAAATPHEAKPAASPSRPAQKPERSSRVGATKTETTVVAESAPRIAEPPAEEPPTEAPTVAEPPAPEKPLGADESIPFMHEGADAPETEAPSAGSLVVRSVGALALVVGLLVGAAFLMKRLGGPRFGAPAQDGPELAVVSSVALGDRRSLTVVRFGERTLLLGSTANGITLLADDADTPPLPVRSVGYLLEADGTTTFDDELERMRTTGDGGRGFVQ